MEQKYCPNCMKLVSVNEKGRCKHCRSKTKEPEGGHFVYLTELDFTFSDMFEEILKNNNIPYYRKESHSVVLQLYWAADKKSKFYVPLELYDSAKELLDEYITEKEDENLSVEADQNTSEKK